MRPFKDFISENKKNKKISSGTDYIMMNMTEFKEEQYKFINLLPTVLHFLLGKTSQNKMAEFEKIWEDKLVNWRVNSRVNLRVNWKVNW